ncbi:DNA/RNA helicase domain-containing protein [Tahibacter sp. UC22_41]|uniref:DNA/RNA helicase domain-containing protein n=1 Tax=Tahibacter sp. UC22_41 TaxID=3350178 RepID=UPI0036D9E61B
MLYGSIIFVVEFKVRAEAHDAMSRWQVQSYGMDLRDFHAGSRGRVIVPVLCATRAEHQGVEEDFTVVIENGIADVVRAGANDLAERLLALAQYARRDDEPIEPNNWLASPYRPTPTIIEAAVRLYEGHGVRELSHRHAHNLDLTTQMLVQEIELARLQRRRVICFVTGIPGAGKTLTGLDVVHDPELRGNAAAAGIFLSGNGPLVKVVREALVIHQTRKGRRRKDCVHEVGTFIQNVHQFLRYHRENPEAMPHEHVVVFDEAQRAWDQGQMSRKYDVAASEAAELLDVMERLPEWALVIALVGGGQEIYLGEAGLEEWGRALTDRVDRWHVVASPEVLGGGESVAGHRLFDGPAPPESPVPRRTSGSPRRRCAEPPCPTVGRVGERVPNSTPRRSSRARPRLS